MSALELSVVMPCLNEARTVAICIKKALDFMERNGVAGEVVIADNGSTDGSQQLAEEAGARVVPVSEKGYGNALMGGFRAAQGRYIVMGDADDSYDFSSLEPFLAKLREGYQLVMGNRFRGGIAPGAMPIHHRYLGNPVLTGIGRLFFNSKMGDFHCGLRGFHRDILEILDLRTTGMEFASELVVKSELNKLKICEVPTRLAKDGRGRPPHLNSWRDGWRHLRFLLLYSPRWLFYYPGTLLVLAGLGLFGWLLPGPRRLFDVTFDVHTLLYASGFILLGTQALMFGFFARVFAISEGLMPRDPKLDQRLDSLYLEKGLIAGTLLTLCGLIGSVLALGAWRSLGYGQLDVSSSERLVIPAVTCLLLGGQLIMGSFFLSLLRLGRR
ncbi:dolichol-P-glucose synthetase [bacterium SCN 62-11]|nr:glycosyltransferase family 2 protein [Candidatus Eremiobacteraeota bacterium]ODT73554.1 MAG: dolichol-P-glucose synthetase [bacterium SCN 62-11]